MCSDFETDPLPEEVSLEELTAAQGANALIKETKSYTDSVKDTLQDGRQRLEQVGKETLKVVL